MNHPSRYSILAILSLFICTSQADAFWFFKRRVRNQSRTPYAQSPQSSSRFVSTHNHNFGHVPQPAASFPSMAANTPPSRVDHSIPQAQGYIARRCPHCGKIKYFKPNFNFNDQGIASPQGPQSTIQGNPRQNMTRRNHGTDLPESYPSLTARRPMAPPLTEQAPQTLPESAIPITRRYIPQDNPELLSRAPERREPLNENPVSKGGAVDTQPEESSFSPAPRGLQKKEPTPKETQALNSNVSDKFGYEMDFIMGGGANACMGTFVAKHKAKRGPQNYCDFAIATAGHCAYGNWTKVGILGLNLGRALEKREVRVTFHPNFRMGKDNLAGRSDTALLEIQAPCDKIPNDRIVPLAPVAENGTVMLSQDRRLYQQKRYQEIKVTPKDNPHASQSQWVTVNSGGGGLMEGEYGSYQALVFRQGENVGEIYDPKTAQALLAQDPSLRVQPIPGTSSNQWKFLINSDSQTSSEVGDSGAPILNARGQLAGVLSGGTPGNNDFVFDQTGVHFIKNVLARKYPSGPMGPEFAANWNPPAAKIKQPEPKQFLTLLASK